MCGIIGYVGPRDAPPILLAGLGRLEYRGYDSAGIATLTSSGRMEVRRAVGKLGNLRRLIDEAYQSAYTIINSNQDAMHRISAALLERETIDAEEVKLLIEGKELPPMRSVLASPSDTEGPPQQVLKPESRGGPGFPEGSPSPA